MKQKISSREFYQLVVSADQAEINKVTEVFIHRLAGYLRTVHKADPDIAADCSHQAFTKVFEKIRKGELTDVDNMYSYLIRSAKNEYLMILRRQKSEVPGRQEHLERIEGDSAADVAQGLYTEDKENVLKACIEMLRKGRQTFYWEILKFINDPDAVTARKLGMSHASFRTRKSRLIQSLRECVKNKGY